MIASNEKLLLNLIKIALGKSAECALPDALEWSTLFGLSVKQCVPSVVLDGLNKSLVSAALPGKVVGKTDKLKWLGMLLNMERQYAIHESVVAALAAAYQSAGYRMMLLKGYGLSKYWPIPNHRPTGDIDIYLMYMDSDGKDKCQPAWKRADLMMKENFGVEIDNSHHHHSVFTYKGIMVENHYDFINVHSHRSNQWIENEFKTLALMGSEEYTFDNGAKLLFPSPLLNCLFVARHNACHFAAEHLNLRQLLDWALFVEKRNEDMDWDYFWSTAKKMGMEKFVLCMAFIAIEQLSFEKSIFHIPDEYMDFQKCEHDLIDKVFDDILHPTDEGNDGKGLVYVVRRFKLWKRNLWKHRIVYSDSVVSTFCAQIKSHLMKPTTIFGI
mgnify:FL=1